jgi:anaerobic magnesium-protoporphyrin IX monomethyl ester cyclase
MKVVLLSPVSRVLNHYRPPLALMYLSGYLEKTGIDTGIVDITLKEQIRDGRFHQNKERYLEEIEDKTINALRQIDADIVGITCYTPELQEVERLARRVKSVKPLAKIIAGGIHPTLYPEDFLAAKSDFDFVVIGEGELTLHELVKAIRSGNKNYSEVKGIGYFDRQAGKIIITPPQALAENLDDIAFPDYRDMDMGFYTTASPYSIRGVLPGAFIYRPRGAVPHPAPFAFQKSLGITMG